jgi:hypothetical protein
VTDDEKLRRLELTLAHAGNTHAVSDVAALLRDRKAQFWTNGDGCIITEITEFPRLKTVNYWLIFGALRSCLELEQQINTWAIENGCTVATASGRPGWLRVAAPTGWRLRGYAYAKALNQ